MTKHISDFSGADGAANIPALAEFLRSNPGASASLEAKTYTLSAPIDLSGADGATLDGGGATLVFDRTAGALTISGAEAVTVKNLTLEPSEKSYIRADILSVDTLGMNLLVSPSDSARAQATPCGTAMPVFSRNEERFTSTVACGKIEAWGDGSLRITGDYPPDISGDDIYIPAAKETPAVRVCGSSCVTLENINIFGGDAGISCDGCRDVSLLHVMAVPYPGDGMCTPGVGAEFYSCTGALSAKNCVFEGHGEDAVRAEGEGFLFTGCTFRSCLGRFLVLSGKNTEVEGCLFDGAALTAIRVSSDADGKTAIKNNRIIRRGEKYRFSPEHDAGGICVIGGEVGIIGNMAVCPDTQGAIFVSGADKVTVRANELLCTDPERKITAENCGRIETEGNI